MKDLTIGNEGKLILQFAVPMLLGNIFQQLYNIVDSIIVGNYISKEALAAVGASFPIVFALISFVVGIAGGFTIIISQYFGAKDIDKVRKTIDTMYLFLFFASIFVSAIGIYFTKDIFSLMQVPEEVMPMASEYLKIYLGGIVVFFGFHGTSAILRGMGDSKTPLYFMIISTITNIILDYLFVVVFHKGVQGVAIATIISQGGAFITAILYLNKTHPVVKLTTWRLHFERAIFKKSLQIGIPSGIQNTIVSVGMITLFSIVNTFGANTAAAYSVSLRIDSLASMIAMNFSAALSTFVGQNIGANKIDRIKKGLVSTLFMSSTLVIIMMAIIINFNEQLISLFTNDIDVIRIGSKYLIIVSSFHLLFSTMFIFNGVMRGAGDTLMPMFFTLIALWFIRIPVAYFLSAEIGVTGIWWATPIGWFFGMTATIIYYFTGRWKKRAIVKYNTN